MFENITDNYTFYNPSNPRQYKLPANITFDDLGGYSIPTSDVKIKDLNDETGEPILEDNLINLNNYLPYSPNYSVTSSPATNSTTNIKKMKTTTNTTYNTPATAGNLVNKLLSYDKDLTPEQASGIVGLIFVESSFKFGNTNPNDLGAASKGAIQWLKDRLNNLKSFAKERGKPWTDQDILLQFLLHELKSPLYKKYYDKLKLARTSDEAAEALSGYIGYAGWDGTTKTAKTLMKTKGWSEEKTLQYINEQHAKRKGHADKAFKLWQAQA